MKFILYSDIKNGKLSKKAVEGIQSTLKAFEGKRIELTIDKVKSTRSNQQNRYYWSGVVGILSTELGYSKDEIHDLLKYKFLKRTVIIGDSEETIMKSTTELTKSEFMDFIADIQLWAAELNINIPDPGTQIDLTL